jgi:hypothetical protein
MIQRGSASRPVFTRSIAAADVWAYARGAWWYYYANQPEGVETIA